MSIGELRALALPYCLDRRPCGCYVVLNRRYKPVGFATLDWVDYGAYPIAMRLPELGARLAARLSSRGEDGLDRVYLYHDSCIPTRSAAAMREYLERLRRLMRMKAQPCPHAHHAAVPARSLNP